MPPIMGLCITTIQKIELWIRKRKYRLEYLRAHRTIKHASLYLEDEFLSWASNQDRGRIMPYQSQAIHILKVRSKSLRAEADWFLYE